MCSRRTGRRSRAAWATSSLAGLRRTRPPRTLPRRSAGPKRPATRFSRSRTPSTPAACSSFPILRRSSTCTAGPSCLRETPWRSWASATPRRRAGLTIVSGLALGVDAAAHRGALEGDGSTVAVLGSGIDVHYPPRNADLQRAIAARGALLSEFALGTPPAAGNFPRRNRLISGLARGVLVVEAALDSGSLITARLAADQGRDVFAIPGSIHSPLAKGCHALLKEGAKLVESAQDVLDELRVTASTLA